MAEGEGSVYSNPGPETRMTTFDGAGPTSEEGEAQIRKMFAEVLAKRPISVVIYAEFDTGVVAAALGSPLTLVNLMELGKAQILDMLKRSSASGENG